MLFMENIQYYAEGLFTLMGITLLINMINWLFLGSILHVLGITPRTIYGILGVIFAPILHGNVAHFVMNAFPFFCLSLLMIAPLGIQDYCLTLISISLISGALIWLLARPGTHIGASAMITGMFSWLVYNSYLNPSPLSTVILMIVLFYFGSIIVGIIPSDQMISWEGHLMGLIAGIIVALYQPLIMKYALMAEIEILDALGIQHWSQLTPDISSMLKALKG